MPQDKKKQPFQFTPFPGSEQQVQEPYKPITQADIQSRLNNHLQETIAPIAKPVVSSLSTISDVLSSGQYASAKFFQSFNEDTFDSFSNALVEAGKELVNPKDKLSFGDVIRKGRKDRGLDDGGAATHVLGFIADLTFDPLTYLGVGLAKRGLSIGGKTLSKEGTKVLGESLKQFENTNRFVSKGDDVLKILDKEAIRTAKGAKEYTFESKKALTDAGYFQYVADKADEIYNFAKSNGVDLPKHQAAILAREEVYKDLRTQNKIVTNNFLNTDEVREMIEDRISRITDFDTNSALKLFEPSGLRLTVGLPFGKQYDIPGSRQVLRAVGLDGLQNKIRKVGQLIGETRTGNVIGRTFVKEFDPTKQVPQEFWDELHSIENVFDSTSKNVIDTTRELFKGISTERRTAIGKVMSDIRDASFMREQQLGRALTQQEANEIKSVAFSAANLTPKEFAVTAQLYQDYSKMLELEMRSDLLSHTVTNYTPRKWQMLSDPFDVPDLLRAARQGKLNIGMSSSKATKYATLAEGIADGNVPELDAAVLYANRLIASREKLAVANFNQSVRYTFGFDPSPHPLKPSEIATLPKVVQSNIKMLGDAVYPAGMNDELQWVLRGVDKLNSWFKRGAYAIKPSAAPRQAISNTFQAAMLQGVKTFKAFDPRALADAGLLFLDRGKPTKNLPNFITNFFKANAANENDAILASRLSLEKITGAERLTNYSNNFKLKSALGQEYDGNYLIDWMQKNGVIKGFDASGEAMKVKVERALKYNSDSVSSVAGELAKFWNWPALTEDYSRAMLFLNGLRMGYSEKQSLAMVNKALFDYSRGLSYMEKNVFKKLIPFYTYQRFAVPYVLNRVVTKPGDAITGEKLMKLMEKLIVSENDTLTPSEQESIPGFVLEQPRLFRGFDKDDKAKFNIFNNMTPLDALSILQYDKTTGELDYRRTMEKTVLAQLTPFLKIPLEEITNKNFFTEQTIDKAGKLGDINDSTISAVMPDEFKQLIGWENRIDKRTGKQSVYINPYLAHRALGFVPGLKSWIIDPSDQGQSELERAMEFISGIKTERYDLKEQAHYKKLKQYNDLKEAQARIRSAWKRGSQSEFEKAKADLKTLVEVIKENKIDASQVRGRGINPVELPPELNQEQEQ